MDIAALGLKVDSREVAKATPALDRMTAAANRAEAATLAVATGSRQAGQAAASLAQKAQPGYGAVAAAAKRAGISVEDMRARMANASANVARFVSANSAAAAATRSAAQASNAAAAALNGQSAAAAKTAGAMVAANSNIRRTSGSASGLAAQFQDIGVTAAAGMNPLIIGLQQGTQIAGQMETAMQGGQSAVGALTTAFKSLLSPVAFASIALTALAAAGLQMVNWAKLAKSVLNALASAIQPIAPYAAAAAAGLALLYAPAVLAGLGSIGAALYGIERAMIAVLAIGWPALLVAGIVALGAVAVKFRDDLTRYLGVDIVGAAKAGANYLIGSFVLAFERVKTTWQQLPNMILAALTSAKNMVTGGTQNAAADAVSKAFGSIDAKGVMNFDYISAGLTGVAKGASLVASKFKEWANAIGGVDKAAEKEAKRYDDIINKANSRIASLSAEQAALGLSEFAAAKLKYETELLNQAQERGVTLTDARRATFSALASTMASVEIATKRTKEAIDFAKDATKGFLSDLRTGLQNGEGFWRSFGNAALNVIDKIVDRIETNLVNALFDAKSAGGGSGGLFGSILGGIGSLFGGGSSSGVLVGGSPLGQGGIGHNATGTDNWRGGLTWVGEKEPELIDVPRGARITPMSKLGRGGSQAVTFNMNVNVQGNGDKELMARMKAGAEQVMAAGLAEYDRHGVRNAIQRYENDPRAA